MTRVEWGQIVFVLVFNTEKPSKKVFTTFFIIIIINTWIIKLIYKRNKS